MAFNDAYRESIQTKHIANVGFTSTAKGVSNEAFALKNPHQLLPSQIPAIDVVGTHGPLTADGISAGVVEQHTVKLTADPTVNDNKAWFATEDNCTEPGHAARGEIHIDQWMRYAETQYKLRLYEDDGTGNSPNMSAEIFPSETEFNWEYDSSTGIVYFDEDPATNGKTTPLWGVFYTYVGDLLSDKFDSTVSGVGAHNDLSGRDVSDAHPGTAVSLVTSSFDGALSVSDQEAQAAFETLDDAVQANTDNIVTTSGTLQQAIDDLGEAQDEFIELEDTISAYNEGRVLYESSDAVVDDAAFTYVSSTQTLNVANMDIDTDLTVGADASVTGDVTVDGVFGFDAGTTINEIVTTVDENSTDDQVVTAAGTFSLVNTTSGVLQGTIDDLDSELTGNIIWEVVDTPFEQIRPKVEHQGKALYTAGNLTIGGDLTVSGTTTTVHSEELTVADKTITVNASETGAGITGDQYAGIEIDRGSESNYMFVFDEVQDNFRVGISGSLQAVATREDNPIDTRVPWWNGSEVRFDTIGNDYITVMSGIDMYASSVNVLSLDETSQTLGNSSSSYINVSDSGVVASENNVEVINLSETSQVIGVAADTNISLDQGTDTVTIDAVGTPVAIFSTAGMQLAVGTTVNEIIDSTQGITSASTDDQLATAKAIFNELGQTVISGTPTYMYYVGADGNLAETSNMTYDGTDWIFTSTAVQFSITDSGVALNTGPTVNEIVTTVTSGTTDSQLPTAKAVWDVTEAAAAAVHIHHDVDAVYVSDTSWTYGSSYSAVPDGLQLYVNGVKQRIGSGYDCTVAVPAGVLTITFSYSVRTSDWVNVTYYV